MSRFYRIFATCLVALPGLAVALNTGTPVSKISGASKIDSWEALDARHVVLSFSTEKNFLVTLQRDCHSLPRASNVGVSASNDTIYAGFDYITADGQRCAIQAIDRLPEERATRL